MDRLIEVFQRYLNVETTIVYGSRAKGNYRPGSDLDLTLVGPNLNTNDLLSIADELDDLLLPQKIDLSIQHHIENPALLEHIQRVGKILYSK